MRRALSLLALAVAVLPSCRKAESGKPRLAFVINATSPFWEPAFKGLERASAEFGIEATWEAPNGPVEKQIDLVESLLARGVEAIVVSPLDPDALASVLRRAKEKGVEVLTVDSDSPASGRTAYIGTNNRRAGERAGREMVRLLGEKGGKVAGFVGYLTAANARERIEGFRAGIAGSRVELVEVYPDETDAGKAQNNVEAALRARPDLAGLFTIWSYDAPAAGRALKGAGLVGKIRVVGFDAEPQTLSLLEEGVIDACVGQKPYEFGYQSVRLFHAIRTKGRAAALAEIAPDGVLDTGIEVITRESLPAYREKLRSLGIRSS
jgi:ribose transport system substrate-binding protein